MGNKPGILESQSLWYQYKTEVWPREGKECDSPQAVTVHNIMRAVRAFRNTRQLAYVSVPITSGLVYYGLQRRQPDARREELLEQAISTNYHNGLQFVERLAKRLEFDILYPADLTPSHEQWEQKHFQALWLSIIAEKATELHMSQGWEFSNGGVEEFTHVQQLKLGVPNHPDLVFFNTKGGEEAERQRMKSILAYDHEGGMVGLDSGRKAIAAALEWIAARGFKAPKIERCYSLLEQCLQLRMLRFYQ